MPDTKFVVSLLFFFFFFFSFVDPRGIRHRSRFERIFPAENISFLIFDESSFLRYVVSCRRGLLSVATNQITILRPSPPSKFLISSRSAAKEKSGIRRVYTGTVDDSGPARGPFASADAGQWNSIPQGSRLEIVRGFLLRTIYRPLKNYIYIRDLFDFSRVNDLDVVSRIFRPSIVSDLKKKKKRWRYRE